jgi:hypothetical protein
MKALFEIVRWDSRIRTVGEEFKITNTYSPYYARLVMRQEPDLADVFELKRSAADQWLAELDE